MAENKTSRAIETYISPNLLFSTIYALDNSFSKRITVGLEYHDKSFIPVVKFSESTSNQVTFDAPSWEIFIKNMDMIECYFKDLSRFFDDYERSSKIYLSEHYIELTSICGESCIKIINRPNVTSANVTMATGKEEDDEDQPASKKKKINHSTSIVIKAATFDSIQEIKECISEKMYELNLSKSFVNRLVNLMIDYAQLNLIETKSNDEIQRLLNNYSVFKKYCFRLKPYIKEYITELIKMDHSQRLIYKMFLAEFFAFGLNVAASKLHKLIFKTSLENL